jgi:ferrochelatase
MKIEDILNLTEGTLSNTPKVQAIESATVYVSKVDQGDLFFSSNQEEIDQAIQNGAYAIVYDDQNITRNDEEIAWIKVTSIQLAAFKLIRYVTIKKEAQFFHIAEHELTFLKMILTHKTNISFISNDWRKAFEQILNSQDSLFVGTDKELMQLIKPDVQKLEREVDGYAVFDTLFKTTFKVGGFVYQEKDLIPFHLDYLLRVIHFCESNALPYSIERLKHTKHFTPVYINAHLQSTKANNSDQVAIFTDNIADIVEAREYIKRTNTWVKGIVITPPKTKVPRIDRPHWFETEEELREILKNTLFNYAFIYKADRSILNKLKAEYTLF